MPKGKGAYLSDAQKTALLNGRRKGLETMKQMGNRRKSKLPAPQFVHKRKLEDVTMAQLLAAAKAVRDRYQELFRHRKFTYAELASLLMDDSAWHPNAKHAWMTACLNMVWPMFQYESTCPLFPRKWLELLLGELGVEHHKDASPRVLSGIHTTEPAGKQEITEPWNDLA